LLVGAALTALLIAVYLFTFSGYAISGDEWALFDATESLARRGDLRLNYLFDQYPPLTLSEVEPPPADAEPLQPLLAAPLIWLGEALPAVGLVHTVWLFNVIVAALTAAVLYAYGLALGYRVRAAAAVALAFGIGTIAWPYSRTFFREPLFTLLALTAAALALRVRQGWEAGRRRTLAAIGLALALAAALLSKEAGLLLLPAIVVQLWPRRAQLRWSRRALVAAAAVLVLAALLGLLLLNLDTLLGLSSRYAFTARLEQARANLSRLSDGVRGYLYSPARGIFWFSPVLLMGVFGVVRLARARRWREIAAPLALLATFVVGYAAVRGELWYGGRGWGARYMLPVTPFLALWLLPAAESLLARGAAWWKRLGALALLAISVGVQIVAVVVPIETYYARLAAQTPPVVPWLEGAWRVRWSPIVVGIEALSEVKADLVWRYAAGPAWLLPLLAAALAGLALALLVWALRRTELSRQALRLSLMGLALATSAALLGGLYAVRLDPRMYGDFAPARALLSALDDQLHDDDVIALDGPTYAEFFMNSYQRRAPEVFTLPRSPGERPSPEQAPALVSALADERIHLSDTLIVAHWAEQHERLWLVTNASRFIPWALRPLEEYLSRHYFPVRAVAPSDLARAALFDLTPAPAPTAAAWPAHAVGATFGGALELVGFDAPGGLTRAPGDVLPVSLLWRATEAIGQDYTVAVFVIGPDGVPVAQRDSFPLNGFAPTSSWRPGALQRDNHGLALPADLPPDEYALWVVVYPWQTPGDRLPVNGPAGAAAGGHVVLGAVIVGR